MWFRKKKTNKLDKLGTKMESKNIGNWDGYRVDHVKIHLTKPIKPGKPGRRVITEKEFNEKLEEMLEEKEEG